MNTLPSANYYLDAAKLNADGGVYTDLHSLQSLKNNSDKNEAIRQVAQQFESLFINLMLKSMRDANAVFEQDSLFTSQESNFYRDMYDQQISLSLAHGNKGVGIADALYRQMTETYKNHIQESEPNDDPRSLPRDTKRPSGAVSSAQPTTRNAIAETPQAFIEQLQPHAEKAAQQLGVSPSLLMAQAALETGWGKFVLNRENGDSSFNLFNIKAGSNWQGETCETTTLEYREGTFAPEKACFRSYPSLAAAFEDYVRFVQQSPRYQGALQADTDQGYIQALHTSGYATDPQYADKVLRVFQQLNSSQVVNNGEVKGA